MKQFAVTSVWGKAAALQQMPPEESQAIIQQLQVASLIGVSSGPDMNQVLQNFEPLLQVIAAVARGDDGLDEQDAHLIRHTLALLTA